MLPWRSVCTQRIAKIFRDEAQFHSNEDEDTASTNTVVLQSYHRAPTCAGRFSWLFCVVPSLSSKGVITRAAGRGMYHRGLSQDPMKFPTRFVAAGNICSFCRWNIFRPREAQWQFRERGYAREPRRASSSYHAWSHRLLYTLPSRLSFPDEGGTGTPTTLQ